MTTAEKNILFLRKGGHSLREIAVLVQTSPQTVWRRLQSAGVDTKRPPKYSPVELRKHYDKGLIDKEVAKAVGCSSGHVFKWRKVNKLKPNGKPGRKPKVAS